MLSTQGAAPNYKLAYNPTYITICKYNNIMLCHVISTNSSAMLVEQSNLASEKSGSDESPVLRMSGIGILDQRLGIPVLARAYIINHRLTTDQPQINPGLTID